MWLLWLCSALRIVQSETGNTLVIIGFRDNSDVFGQLQVCNNCLIIKLSKYLDWVLQTFYDTIPHIYLKMRWILFHRRPVQFHSWRTQFTASTKLNAFRYFPVNFNHARGQETVYFLILFLLLASPAVVSPLSPNPFFAVFFP